MQQVVDEMRSLSFVNMWIPITEVHYLSMSENLMEIQVSMNIRR